MTRLVSVILLLGVPGMSAWTDIDEVQRLISRAEHTSEPRAWAGFLMQADAAAEKLEARKPGGCCGYRCVRVGSFNLHYRYNEIGGSENYQHDLLQLVAQTHAGTPEGAEALVRLLPTGCQTIASDWTPYFRTVLGILESRPWRALADARLTRIRAEAYETWWSFSKAKDGDPMLTDMGLTPKDFLDGAAQARERAIAAYQSNADAAVARRLRQLLAGQDTEQRRWFCGGD